MIRPTPAQLSLWRKRDYSWSQHSSFHYNPLKWYERYVLGIEEPATPELLFGKKFADSCEIGKPLAPVTMLARMEQDFKVPFSDFFLIGYADTFCDKTNRIIGEYKTGMKAWDQKRVDQHGQITMYCLMNLVKNDIKPEETKIFLEWIPTARKWKEKDETGFDYEMVFATDPAEVVRFETSRTMSEVMAFGGEIIKTRKAMEDYVKNI